MSSSHRARMMLKINAPVNKPPETSASWFSKK
jgi:hypothetical protein